MGQKLPPDQLELYRRTDEVLHYIWDPIGVAGDPYARDEYDSYLPHVYSHLLKGDEQGIRNYLLGVTENEMGMDASQFMSERIDRTVESLFEWKRKCLEEADQTSAS